MNKIILASGSPRRKKLLQQINFSFKVHPSNVDESYDPSLSPDEIVQELASRKAKDIAQHYKHALVIGADTIVVFENQILEKPANQHEAQQMLSKLSGQTHQVLTGIALYKVDSSQNIMESNTFFEVTDVIFGDLKSHNIDAYVASGSPMDKAGSYGIQDDYGAIFVRRIEGDYYNVVGFPLHRFYTVMETFAPEFLPRIQIDEQADE